MASTELVGVGGRGSDKYGAIPTDDVTLPKQHTSNDGGRRNFWTYAVCLGLVIFGGLYRIFDHGDGGGDGKDVDIPPS